MRTALLAKDDCEMGAAVERGVREHGHAVTAAGAERNALFLALGETFDVVILDRLMPVMDGMTGRTLVRDIARAHGGAATLHDNQPGATFMLTLPRKRR